MTTYAYTGAIQTYVVPAGVYYVEVNAAGAQGGHRAIVDPNYIAGGPGAFIRSAHVSTPGETLNVLVGEHPIPAEDHGGWNGGGDGGHGGGGGTDVRRGGTAISNRIVSAGGGAGQGLVNFSTACRGGPAGYPTGQFGAAGDPNNSYGSGGAGGTQTAGGARGGNLGNQAGQTNATDGYLAYGGTGAKLTTTYYGSGGGGGWYGGGGGGQRLGSSGIQGGAGGGGGSSRTLGLLLSYENYNTASRIGHGIATVSPYVPATPVISVPAANAVVGSAMQTVTWNGVDQHPTATGTKALVVQYSPVSNFASGVVEFSTVNSRATSGTGNAGNLTQGVWYMRAKMTGTQNLADSAWTATRTVTVAHAPTATVVSPTLDAYKVYAATTPFVWNVGDTNAADYQKNYQIIVEVNDDATVVIDTGKVSTPTGVKGHNTVSLAMGIGNKGVQLRWKVRTWDTDDVPSAYSSYSIFTLVDVPEVAITAPLPSGTVDTGAPTFEWTVADLGPGRLAIDTLVEVREVSTNLLIWSGSVGAELTITPESTVLANTIDYSVMVTVVDNKGLIGSSTQLFTTSYISPPSVAYEISDLVLNTAGYVLVDWSASQADETLAAWVVYRRDLPDNAWRIVAEIPNEGTRTFADYLVKSGSSYMYSVTQIADRSGVLLESPPGYQYNIATGLTIAEGRTTLTVMDNYWIINTDTPSTSVLIPNVTSDPSTEEYEEATYTIIGRGRHRDYGDRLGYTGALECKIRIPEFPSSVRLAVEALRAEQETYYLRTPFGKLFQVALGNPGWSPVPGVGNSEMGDMSIPYDEVM